MQVKQLSSYGNKYLISDTRSHLVTETSTVITLEIFTVIGRPTSSGYCHELVRLLPVCHVSQSWTPTKQLDGSRCHLAQRLAGGPGQPSIVLDGDPTPHGKVTNRRGGLVHCKLSQRLKYNNSDKTTSQAGGVLSW